MLVGPPGWVNGSAELLTPHPDYYTSILWRQLVGRVVLDTTTTGDATLRAAFDGSFWCASARSPYGVGSVVLAWTNSGTQPITLTLPADLAAVASTRFVLAATADGTTPVASLTSDDMYLNGNLLTVTAEGSLPEYPLPGVESPPRTPVIAPARTYGFIAFSATVPACVA